MKTPPVQDYIGNGDLPPDKEFDPGIFNTYSEYTPKQGTYSYSLFYYNYYVKRKILEIVYDF